MKYILTILKRNKWKLFLIYFYIFAAQLLVIFEPFILGKAIDGLLQKNYFFLIILFVIFAIENVFMYRRMVYDTKVYTEIYNDIVLEYLKRDEESDVSTKVARSELMFNVIHFIEHDFHYYIAAFMSLIGSFYFVFIQNDLTSYVMFICIPLIVLITRKFYKKIEQSTKIRNSHFEQKFKTVETGDFSLIGSFFNRRKKLVVAQSTIFAKNWVSLNLTKCFMLTACLVIFTIFHDEMTHGQTISIYAYINQFLNSLMVIPIAVENYTRIRDIIKRISF
jgi:hypothetical protein